MDKPMQRTALIDTGSISSRHTLSEIALCGKINLRGNVKDSKFKQGAQSIFGASLPDKPNTISSTDTHKLFWLGPDEWLVHVPLALLEQNINAIRQLMTDQLVAATEVSDYYSVIELSGPQALEIIASASPFDTRPHHFDLGQCAQTRFGHASILLWPEGDAPSFQLQVRWSYAKYVYDYLCESIRNAENLAKFQHLA